MKVLRCIECGEERTVEGNQLAVPLAERCDECAITVDAGMAALVANEVVRRLGDRDSRLVVTALFSAMLGIVLGGLMIHWLSS